MKISKKGCVYFFRHIGLKPIKIGYSENESPIDRFNQFKTYAPFGAELLGFVIVNNSKQIETNLHQKYAAYRLNGEWFDITEEEVNREVNYYSNQEQIELKNEFQIEWAKEISRRNRFLELGFINKKPNTFSIIQKIVEENPNVKPKEISKELNISLTIVYRYLRLMNQN